MNSAKHFSISATKLTLLFYAAILLYSGSLLLPHLFPDLPLRPFYAGYRLTLIPVFLGIVAILVVSGLALPVAWFRGESLKPCLTPLLLACFSLFCFISVIALNNRLLPPGSYRQRFDADLWRQVSTKVATGAMTARQKMVGDVVKNILPGRSRSEIEELLGPSEEKSETELVYNLGRIRGALFPLGDEWLVITLDASARFKAYEISRDD